MEKISNLSSKQALALAGAGVLAAGALYYATRGPSSSTTVEAGAKLVAPNTPLTDKNFEDENLVSYNDEADARAKQVSNVSYKLVIKLQKLVEYQGLFEALFTLKDNKADVYLDFQGKEISQVQVNGKNAAGVKFEKHRIVIPAALLIATGENKVSLAFKNTYVSNGAGLHHYQDPKDQKVYIFSHCEPFFCHRFFPCFDQPSIRAPLKLQVVVPDSNWQVIANGAETQKPASLSDHQKMINNLDNLFNKDEDLKQWTLWDFSVCPAISSYIYNLCAGDYEVIQDTQEHAPTPMRIFVRNSKKDYVDSEMVFKVITEGINFYSNIFACEFPFAKYDIIYCPEFRITAMENVGAITFTDRILMPADELDDNTRMIHYKVHLHELAHMWFGDLTTMFWWNDLWLKESFADFLCAYSFQKLVETRKLDRQTFKDVGDGQIWLSFLQTALEADLKPSTHPISQEIKHTGDAVSTFDEISYRKGASWLKTMRYFFGEETMRKGLQKYVKKFAYKNAVLTDMIECMQEAHKEVHPTSSLDMKQWTDSWLKTKGPTEIQATFQDGELKLTQSFPENADKVFKQQTLEVTLFYKTKDGYDSHSIENLTLEAQEVTSFKDLKIPEEFHNLEVVAIMPNSSNCGYCRVVLDAKSVEFFQLNLGGKPVETQQRCYLWRILYDHVFMMKLKGNDFVKAVIANLKSEDQSNTLPYIMMKACQMIGYKLQGDEVSKDLSKQLRAAVEQKLGESMSHTSNRNLLLDYYIALTDTQDAQQVKDMQSMVEHKHVPRFPEIENTVNKVQRYACLRKLTKAHNAITPEVQALIDNERKIDFSASDDLELIKIKAAQPSRKDKQQVWDKYVAKKDNYKQQDFIASAQCFYNKADWNECEFFANMWLDSLEVIEDTKHYDYFKMFFLLLSPSFLGNAKHADRMKALVAKYENSDKSFLVRCLKEEIYMIEKVCKIKTAYQ